MIVFSIFSLSIIEHSDPTVFSPKGDVCLKEQKFVTDSSEMGNEGYLDTAYTGEAMKRLEPGRYRVILHSVGENVIIVMRSSKETVERRFNGSENATFKMDVGTYLWVGIVIEDAPDVSYNRTTKRLTLHLEKLDEGYHPTSYGLVALGIAGGVILAVNTVRVHRKKRQ